MLDYYMLTNTPFLPQFPKRLCGRAKRSLSTRMVQKIHSLRQAALFEISAVAEAFIAPDFFAAQDEMLPATKEDIYTRQRTF